MKILILLKLKTSTMSFQISDGGHGLEATAQERLLAIDLRIATPKLRSETIIISLYFAGRSRQILVRAVLGTVCSTLLGAEILKHDKATSKQNLHISLIYNQPFSPSPSHLSLHSRSSPSIHSHYPVP